MLKAVLEWGDTYGGPGFLWLWDTVDSFCSTPLEV